MSYNIQVIPQDSLDILIKDWEEKSSDLSPLLEFKSFEDNENVDVKSIYDEENNIIALFEIRDCQQYVKSMRLLFSPDLAIKFLSSDGEEFIKAMATVTHIVSKVFKDFVKLIECKDRVKIYNDQHEIKTMFIEFAKELTNNGDYKCKFYKNWIEIYKK